MCGVFTTTSSATWDGKIDKILELLAHRGPDHRSWEQIDSNVLMGHTRLEVIGLGAVGRQPAQALESSVVLAFNGEIYNFRDLAAERRLEATSDTQVLAAVVAERRLAALSDLRGMFAFVAWDRRDGSLLAMRDPFGIKPLYVLRHLDGELSVCSEIAPLLMCPEAREIDPIGLGQYLAMGHTGNSHTLFDRIHKLDPGSLYTWRCEASGAFHLTIGRPPHAAGPTLSFEEALQDSVAAHLTADVEVGAFLSSGVDSTLLCAMARRQGHSLRTYTLSMPDSPQMCESGLAEKNAKAMGLYNVKVPARHAEMAAMAPEIVRVHGEPLGDAAVLPLSILARRASEDLKVVLSGEGGDEVFGGYGRYRISKRLGKFSRAMGPISKPLADRWAMVRSDRPRSRAIEAILWGGGLRSHAALLCGDLPLLSRLHPQTHRDVLSSLYADWERVGGDSDLTQAIGYDRVCWLPNTYLEKTDRATMMSSLEARVPYLDAVLAKTAAENRMEMNAKAEPRALLGSLFPEVELPARKLGLAVDVRALLALPQFEGPFAFELHDRSSICGRWFGHDQRELLADRCRRSPGFAFRLAMLGIWEEVNELPAVA